MMPVYIDKLKCLLISLEYECFVLRVYYSYLLSKSTLPFAPAVDDKERAARLLKGIVGKRLTYRSTNETHV